MKEIMLGFFFKGTPLEKFQALCRDYCAKALPKHIRPGALAEIKAHQAAGRRVVVVTASAEDWVKPWADTLGIECIGSRLETKDGKLTGKLTGLNCNGEEKVCRINAHITLADYNTVYAYGDSSGDKQMLALAGSNGHFRPFRD